MTGGRRLAARRLPHPALEAPMTRSTVLAALLLVVAITALLGAAAPPPAPPPAPVPKPADPEAARKEINAWVEGQTHQQIKDLIGPDSIERRTRLALTNAVAFKGAWRRPFPEDQTKEGDFTRPDGSKVKVPMMNQKGAFR